jgi:hypothetical protein
MFLLWKRLKKFEHNRLQAAGVRIASSVGAQRGQVLAVHADHSENIGCCRVRSECQLARKSSKRVQTGEPINCQNSRLDSNSRFARPHSVVRNTKCVEANARVREFHFFWHSAACAGLPQA